uniref:Uncharacterized protein n=1 Tax=Naja naja TaxID=35670 RepID=A0A8C6XP33_NAJNA
MNVLPKSLYLFQMIPILLDKKFFKELDKVVAKFIWTGKKARIKKPFLQDAKSRGGIGLPVWELYYKAASLIWIKDWIKLRNKRILTIEVWTDIRQKLITRIPRWLSTMEAMFSPNTLDISQKLRYHQILDKEGKLKPLQGLGTQGISIDTWSYFQIKLRYNKDVK